MESTKCILNKIKRTQNCRRISLTRVEKKECCNYLQNNLIAYYDNDNCSNGCRNIFFLPIRFVMLIFHVLFERNVFLLCVGSFNDRASRVASRLRSRERSQNIWLSFERDSGRV